MSAYDEIVVYTSVFNNYESLQKNDNFTKKCDFICFTDNPKLKSQLFNIHVVNNDFKNFAQNVRLYKLLPHKFLKRYKYSIWVDGSLLLKKDFDPKKLIDNYLQDNSAAFFRHPERNCLYDECDACIKFKRDSINIIEKQRTKYLKNHYPKNNGLICGSFIIREHNDPQTIELGEAWWREICSLSKRDQISFNYIAQKLNYSYTEIDGNAYDNKYFKFTGHRGLRPKCEAFLLHTKLFIQRIKKR